MWEVVDFSHPNLSKITWVDGRKFYEPQLKQF